MRIKNLKRAFQILIVLLANPLFGSDTLVPRIDTHIHLYDTLREGSSTFLNPVRHEKIYFPHFAQHFVDTASLAGIDYAVVVEASKRREDNFWLMQHVDSSDALVAFIANLDPRDPFYITDLDSLSTYEKFRGIRIRPATPTNPDVYKPIIDPVIDAFGLDRVIFGSNWTLSDMLGSYGDMIAMLDQYLDGREDLTPEMFYYDNINRAYGIN